MAQTTDFQMLSTESIFSGHLNAIFEQIKLLQSYLDPKSKFYADIPMEMKPILDDNRIAINRRYYEAPAGRKGWLATPIPVVKKNGLVISAGYIIIGACSILFDAEQEEESIITVDAAVIDKYDFLSILVGIGAFGEGSLMKINPDRSITELVGTDKRYETKRVNQQLEGKKLLVMEEYYVANILMATRKTYRHDNGNIEREVI